MTWACDSCNKEFDNTVAWDCFPPDYAKVCFRCKWFPHEATSEKLDFKLWCPYCSKFNIPCELHAEECATMKAVEFLKQYLKDNQGISETDTQRPLTDKEDLLAEQVKQKALQEYQQERLRNSLPKNKDT